jgi:hypothetical protein
MNCTTARECWHAHRDAEQITLSEAARLHFENCAECAAWLHDMNHLAAALDDLRDWSANAPLAPAMAPCRPTAVRTCGRPWAGAAGVAVAAALAFFCGLLLQPTATTNRPPPVAFTNQAAGRIPAPAASQANLTVLEDERDRAYAVSTDSSSSSVQVYWVIQSAGRRDTR